MTRCRLISVLTLMLMLGYFPPSVFGFQSWASFQNGGVPADDAKMPTEWSPEKGLKWKVDLAGYGQSTPVVFEDQIYVTSVSGKQKEKLHVQALSAKTGDEVWQHEADNSTPEENTSYVSRAAPTPVCDANGLIAFFEGGNVIALSHAGEVRWELDLTKLHGDVKARHSLASSLEQNDDHVFIWVERETDPYVLAVDKSSGETVWRANGLGSTSWSSPRLIDVGDTQHLVISGSGKMAGLDPVTGERLWDFDEIGGNSTPTPVQVADARFLIGASPGRGESEGGNSAKSNGVIQITKSNDGYKASWLWQADRATCSFGSPMAHNGKAYFVNRQGVVFCLNAETGEEIYARRTPGGSVWATPLALGGNIYLFGKDGTTTILENADEMKEIASNDLWESAPQKAEAGGNSAGPVLYAATPHTGGLLLRRGDILYCVGH